MSSTESHPTEAATWEPPSPESGDPPEDFVAPPELLEELQSYSEHRSLESFVGAIAGRWTLGTFNGCGRPQITRLKNFRGDLFVDDQKMTVLGEVDWKNNIGRSGTTAFLVNYYHARDVLKIDCFGYKVTVEGAQNSGRVQVDYDLEDRRLLFIFRQDVGIPQNSCAGMREGSYMTVA